jgi:hypothetical protein
LQTFQKKTNKLLFSMKNYVVFFSSLTTNVYNPTDVQI